MPPDAIRQAQDTILWAEHIVILYPLWLGTTPAFLEQTFRPAYPFNLGEGSKTWQKKLQGRSARVVVTMGMPALVYRWYFGAHGLKNFRRNILAFSGIVPIRESLIGTIEDRNGTKREAWLGRMVALGREVK